MKNLVLFFTSILFILCSIFYSRICLASSIISFNNYTRDFHFKEHVLFREGIRLHVLESGNPDGPALVFIHGYSQNALAWLRQLSSAELNKTFRLVAFDLRGHGFSDKPKTREAYNSSKVWADDIQSIIVQLKLKNPLLIGWSYGGFIICDYLRHYGDKYIVGINLVSAGINNKKEVELKVKELDFVKLFKNLETDNINNLSNAIIDFISLFTYEKMTLEDFYLFFGFNMIVPSYVRKYLAEREVFNEDIISKIKIPVLISNGTKDVFFPVEVAKRHSSLISTSKLSLYENVGHALQWEKAERYNQELKTFALSIFKEKKKIE